MAARRQGRYRVGKIEVDPRRRLCLHEGAEVALEPQEFDLLEYLVRNPHRAISEAELRAGILPLEQGGEVALGRYLERLRTLLEAASGGELVQDESGGYALEAEVIFEPEIWADSAEVVEPVAPGYEPYLSDEEESDPVEEQHSQRPDGRLRRLLAGAVIAALSLAGIWAGWQWVRRPRPTGVKVVLRPVRDESGQLGTALDTAIRLELEQSPFLAVLDGPQHACSEREADLYVTGQLRHVGRHEVISLEARDCATDERLARSEGIAENAAGLLAVLTPVTADLRRQLGESSASVKQTDKPLGGTRDALLAALGSYAQAEMLVSKGSIAAAIVAMQKAGDEGFLPAQVALSEMYEAARQPELAAASLRRAYEARDSLPKNEAFAVKTEYEERVSGDLQAAADDAKAWGTAYRLDARPQEALARISLQLGEPEEAIVAAQKAIRLNGEDAGAYALLAEGQLEAGRVEEAEATIRRAAAHGLQEDRLHLVHFVIEGLLGDDAGMQAERKWAEGRTAAAEMRMMDSEREFAAGEVRDAEADAASSSALWHGMGMVGEADRHLAEIASIEARLGLTATASATTKDLPEMVDSAPLAMTWAETGELEKAASAVQQALSAHPSGTLWRHVWAPEIEATIALAEGKPEAVIDALRPSSGYEMRSLDISLLRAQAYMAEKQPQQAEMELRRLLSHPDVDPFSVDHALAQLGLARAFAAEGREAEAATEYRLLEQSTWKSADADLPALRAARTEEGKLSAAARAESQATVSNGRANPAARPPFRLPKPTAPRE